MTVSASVSQKRNSSTGDRSQLQSTQASILITKALFALFNLSKEMSMCEYVHKIFKNIMNESESSQQRGHLDSCELREYFSLVKNMLSFYFGGMKLHTYSNVLSNKINK